MIEVKLEPKSESEDSGCDDQVSTSTNSTNNTPEVKVRPRRRRVRKAKKKNQPLYQYDCHVRESHDRAIFGIAFNHFLCDDPMIFATVGSNHCTIYECKKDTGINVKLCYACPDQDELFYACAWSYNKKNHHSLIAVAGARGIIQVIDVNMNETIGNYVGHGQAINDLKFHPLQPGLLCSGSKDHSARLWNIETDVCVAVFGGVEGHRDEVLSIDFDFAGERIISCGMDHSLMIWNINTEEFKDVINASYKFDVNESKRVFPALIKHFPNYSTRDIHRNYVDCVVWFGDFILSKSCENSIVCWKPGHLNQSLSTLKPNESTSTIITQMYFQQCELWFVRFGFNPWHKIIALGNQTGRIYVWELSPLDPRVTHSSFLWHKKCNTVVRQVAFSKDAKVLIAVCDEGYIWRWNRKAAAS